MTMQVVSSSELPLVADDPSGGRTRRLRHAIVRIVVVLLVVAVPVVPFTWWQVSARADVLQSGYSSYSGGAAAILKAGYTTEYCYRGTPGSTIAFGFSVLNSGSHVVTVQSIDELWGDVIPQAITIDPGSDGRGGGLVGPAESSRPLPLVLHPGESRQLYLTLHLPTDFQLSSGQDLLDRVTAHVRSLGVERTVDLHFGSDFEPLWLGISGPNEDGKYCDFSPPVD